MTIKEVIASVLSELPNMFPEARRSPEWLASRGTGPPHSQTRGVPQGRARRRWAGVWRSPNVCAATWSRRPVSKLWVVNPHQIAGQESPLRRKAGPSSDGMWCLPNGWGPGPRCTGWLYYIHWPAFLSLPNWMATKVFQSINSWLMGSLLFK